MALSGRDPRPCPGCFPPCCAHRQVGRAVANSDRAAHTQGCTGSRRSQGTQGSGFAPRRQEAAHLWCWPVPTSSQPLCSQTALGVAFSLKCEQERCAQPSAKSNICLGARPAQHKARCRPGCAFRGSTRCASGDHNQARQLILQVIVQGG